ncbi:hypothetical protein BG46_17180 [Brucella anthropi]|uniref:hypothetical protein n=1 Tax=Brucella anthropi TaxID=529 RepID=UPI000450061F|nr:hypothetical protein [Brucella anthropi]EXL06485.1 hypothetical protein BG46_17180 [Brucella anthropi]
MKTLHIAVACYDEANNADMPVFTVTVTDKEYGTGAHYEKAWALAKEAGYERPFVCFEGADQKAILSAAGKLDLVPRVVAVDFTDGQVHSVRCDAGEIKVICYDTSSTEDYPFVVLDLPVGENGSSVRCWAHVQPADVDPGLAKARD